MDQALAARAIQERTTLHDDWNVVVPLILLRLYPCLEDFGRSSGRRQRPWRCPDLPDPAG